MLITIEGSDGSGKATQTEMLVKEMRDRGYDTESFSFPQYENTLSGKLIRECLSGSRENLLNLDPYITSTLFAVDRFEMKEKINECLLAKKYVVLDRYVTSNMIHQSAKLLKENKKDKIIDLVEWIQDLEYRVFNLPKPDILLYINLDADTRIDRIKKDATRNPSDDSTDTDLAHQKDVDAIANLILERQTFPVHIVDGSKTKEDTHKEIFHHISEAISKSQES